LGIRTIKGYLQRWHLAAKMLNQSLPQGRSNRESMSFTTHDGGGGDAPDQTQCPSLDAHKSLIAAVEVLTSSAHRALSFLEGTAAAPPAALTHGSVHEGSVRTGKLEAISKLKHALSTVEAFASKSEVKLAISGPLQTLSAALGGGDPPAGGYRDSCRSCRHSLAKLECTCSGRSGQGRKAVLLRPFECVSPGIDNQDGCLVCIRLDGSEAKGCR